MFVKCHLHPTINLLKKIVFFAKKSKKNKGKFLENIQLLSPKPPLQTNEIRI